MHKFAILSVMVLGACSGDTGTGKSNNGGSPWTFDVGFDGAAPTDGAANNGSANNGTPGNNGSTNSGFFDPTLLRFCTIRPGIEPT